MPMLPDPSIRIYGDRDKTVRIAGDHAFRFFREDRPGSGLGQPRHEVWLATSRAFCLSPTVLVPTMRFGSPGSSPRASR